VLFEKDADGAVVRAYTRAPGFAGGISGIISQRTDVPVVIGKGKNRRVVYIPKDLYYLYDAQGNVVNLADGFGVLTSAYEYDSYGGKMREEDPTGNMYQFSTKELEPHAGLLYFGARYYDPAVGRWLTPDPLGMADGTNVYAYCGNDPVNRVDPWGLLTIIMHGIGSHAVGYSGALRDYLEQNGETVIEYYWSGNLDNMAEQDQVASNIGSLLNSARKLADALGEDLNVIAHSQGTRLTYKGILRSSANVDNFVTLGSPYASQYSMPPNVSRWTNIWSQTDPISYPSIVTAADDFRITSRHENYWTKEVLNAELLRILNKKLFSLGKERK
jgi:RHS repeat-associated protein